MNIAQRINRLVTQQCELARDIEALRHKAKSTSTFNLRGIIEEMGQKQSEFNQVIAQQNKLYAGLLQ